MKKKFNVFVTAIAVTTFLAFAGCVAKEPQSQTTSPTNDKSEVVAAVNGENITINALNKRAQQWSMMYGEYFVQPEGRLEILEEMISDALMLQEVKKRGLESDPTVTESLRVYREQLEDQFNYYREHMLKNKLVESVVASPKPIDSAEAEKFYQENPQEFGEKPKVWARHILVKSKDEADDIVAKIKKGGDFAQLAAENSLDEPTKKMGGDLGAVEKGMMYPEIDAVLFDMAVGESKAIALKSGFYKGYYSIVMVEKKEEGKIFPFSEVEEQVKEKMTQMEIRSHYQAYVDKLRKKAEVVTYPEKVAAALPGFSHPPMGASSGDAQSVPDDDTHRNVSKAASSTESGHSESDHSGSGHSESDHSESGHSGMH